MINNGRYIYKVKSHSLTVKVFAVFILYLGSHWFYFRPEMPFLCEFGVDSFAQEGNELPPSLCRKGQWLDELQLLGKQNKSHTSRYRRVVTWVVASNFPSSEINGAIKSYFHPH